MSTPRRFTSRLRVRRFAGPAVLLAALCVPLQALACPLPAPDGAYPVGVRHFELVDDSRRGVRGDTPDAPRTLPAVVWYPARSGTAPQPYMDAAAAAVQLPALARNLRYDPAQLDGIGACPTHATPAAPAGAPGAFPLVVLSHGFFVYAAQNTVLAEHLASHGYVVVAIGHPGDSVDVTLADGRTVPTNMEAEKPAFSDWRMAFYAAADHDTRAPLIAGYADALDGSRLGASVASWRDDMRFAVSALQPGAAALQSLDGDVRDALRTADPTRLALAGMSFGGSTAATVCGQLPACRAAVSLDGQNFDPALFDADLDRPLLLLLSDWVRYPMYDGMPSEADFNPNDYAYERWTAAGLSPDVVRLRVPGTRHMAFSDLPLLMPDDGHEDRFGDADPVATSAAVAATTRAFLDLHLRDGDAAGLQHAIEAGGLQPHAPTSTRDWARAHRPASASP